MIISDQRRLFTSAQVCHAFGISRTFLFRLDEIGLSKKEIVDVGAYAGAHYKPEDYCYEFAVPVIDKHTSKMLRISSVAGIR